ncbi:MAG: hypothetical protein HYT78_08310 [Deltaproteobacteria bacterium]|nr:hypothetical protein [Deltaproteobacteria bacterium]
MRDKVIVTIFLIASFGASSVYSDSWTLPETRTYYSENTEFRFTVIPRSLRSQLHFFSDKVEGREPAGALPGGQLFCLGILSRKKADGSYEPVWQGALTNDVSPVSAILSSSGEYVVTFDNWHSMGYGKNAIVIYGPGGNLIRELALTDLMPQEEVARLPRSVSSIWWGRDHQIDKSGKFLIVKIFADKNSRFDRNPEFRMLYIELASGRIFSPDEVPEV